MRFILAALVCALPFVARADEPVDLTAEIAQVDAKFFDAFNTCDLETMSTLFAEDLEFYHDTGGYHDRDETMQSTKANCERKLGLHRTLVEGTLRVYPVQDYGAIQIGKHLFCHVENGKNDCGTFEFVHVWKRTDTGWRLVRVISYGH